MNKLYVIVRSDLSRSQQAVQGGHAVAQFLLEYKKYPEMTWDNGTLVYLKGPGHSEEMLNFFLRMQRIEPRWIMPFYEPDMDDEITSFAVLEPSNAVSDELRGLRLL